MDWNTLDLWNVIVFGAIPLFTVLTVFLTKRKLLWTAPLISTVLAAIVTIAAEPEVLTVGEYRALFLISMLVHLAVTVLLTVIVCAAAALIKRRRGARKAP